jgi:hypothetical protein
VESNNRHIGSGGYVMVKMPGHPGANGKGYVAEHRLVWESRTGTTLPADWIVHHLNGVKTDNRIENLVGLSSRDHAHVLAEKARRILDLETEVQALKDALAGAVTSHGI